MPDLEIGNGMTQLLLAQSDELCQFAHDWVKNALDAELFYVINSGSDEFVDV
jgi:hypothetical protein